MNRSAVLIGYVRVSTKEQDTALQRDALIKYGVPERNIYEDSATGAHMRRPGLKAAIRSARRGDTIVVWKLDRLGRSVIGVLDAIETLEKEGVQVVSVTEMIDGSTAVGRMVIGVLLSMAQMERELISERTKAGLAAKRARGWDGGPKHQIKGYPKRLAKFQELFDSGDVFEMTAPQVIHAMNAADPKAPQIDPKKTQFYYNWKSRGFDGLRPTPDDPLEDE